MHNVHILPAGEKQSIKVEGEYIEAVDIEQGDSPFTVDLKGAIAFPGLVNSHDHLDFNLFPNIGNRVYRNYTEWGADIHQNNKQAINDVLKIPQALRTQWGLYKNLLNGVTTVVNHGEQLNVSDDLINGFQQCQSLHSVGFEKSWTWKLNNPFNKSMVAIHAGEGTDSKAHEEINSLLRNNLFKRKLVAIHGVAMDATQAGGIEALVWCPDSNYFLLDRTADIPALKNATKLLFGTDSTLTASWDIWGQLRLARQLQLLDDVSLFNTVTTNAAKVWGLKNAGNIEKGAVADIVIAKQNAATPMDGFFKVQASDILLVLHKGKIKLFDESLQNTLTNNGFSPDGFSKIYVDKEAKYVWGDLPALMNNIRKYHANAHFPTEITF